MKASFKRINFALTIFILLGMVLALAGPTMTAKSIGVANLVLVDKLAASWIEPGGGGVYSAYRAAGTYDLVSPGETALFDSREAGKIKAGFNKVDGPPVDWDEGLFGFKPNVDITTFASGALNYDVENQYGTNPVWMTILIDVPHTPADNSDDSEYQFVPTSNPAGWHTVDAASGQWYLMDVNGNATGDPLSLSDLATAYGTDLVSRVYLRLGMGDSYMGTNGTVGWVDKVIIGGTTYDFVLPDYWYVSTTGLDTNEGTLASPFLTIQQAINSAAAGDTVNVADGTYAERLVIDKPLSLIGAGATWSAPTGAYPPTPALTTIDATSFTTAGNVIDITALTGDTLIQYVDIKTGDYSNGIHFAGGTDAAGEISIDHVHIIGTNVDMGDTVDQYGLIGGYGDVRGVSLSSSVISNTYDNSVLMELQMGPTTIVGDTFEGGFPSVFYMTYDGKDVTTPQTISNNYFNFASADPQTYVAGIGINPSTYYVDAARRTGKYASFEISGNQFEGLYDDSTLPDGSNQTFKAISVGEDSEDGTSGGVTSLLIHNNTILGTGGKGIQLFGHITGADIHDNTLTGLFQGIKGFTYDPLAAHAFYPENNHIYDNQISGASDKLVQWEGTGVFPVMQNWWGGATGPDPLKMSANVDYHKWCVQTACTSFGPYDLYSDFQGDGSSELAKFTNDGALWYFDQSTGWNGVYLGPDATGYVPRSDFDGDGKADPTKWVASSNSLWYLKSSDSTWGGVSMGNDVTALLAGTDYDGDKKTDPAKYLASGQIWYLGSRDGTWHGAYIGPDGTPISGSDYDGDGRADPAKFVVSAGTIWYFGSVDNAWHGIYIGNDGTPITGSDFDGDGKTDAAKYVDTTIWYFSSKQGVWSGIPIGNDGTPVIGNDFDGDRMTDAAKFVPGANVLWYLPSSTWIWQGMWLGNDSYTVAN